MRAATDTTRFRFWIWLIRLVGVIVPRRLRADWRQEWEAELHHREKLLAEWDRLDWRNKLDLLRRSTSAFWDALWMQSYRWEDAMIQDLRFGFRMLRRQPGFTLVAVLTLALGIGANTAIFSVVNALLLRPLPYMEPDRLVLLSERSREGERLDVAYPNFADWRERAHSFVGMAAAYYASFTLTGVEKSSRLEAGVSNCNFFQLLGVNPQLGRLFTEADDHYGAARTVMLSHELWQTRFGGEPDLIGKTILLSGDSYTVIGVLPRRFEYLEAADLYVPVGLFLGPDSPLLNRGNTTYLHAVARLKPGVTVEQANREMAALGQQLAQEYPAVNAGKSAQAEPLHDVMSESVRQSLWVLLGAVGFILLIACINVANLLLVRAAERQKELAVRQALGAGRLRIVRQLLSESLLIAALGGASGLLVGDWMLRGLLRLAPPEIPQLSRIGLDQTVLLFTFGISVATSFLCGLLPAMQSSKTDLQTALKEGGRSTTGARQGMRKALLIAEVSLSLVLLVGAGLLVRSMYNLLHVDLGFNADNLLTMRVSLSDRKYDPSVRRRFYDECLARVGAVPGVRSVALAMSVPIRGASWDRVFIAFDKPVPSRADLPRSDYIPVSRDYFETMGMRLLRGRSITAADTAESTPVVVINETLARRIWPGEDPIGKRLKPGYPESDEPWCEVIGLVNDVKFNGVERETSMQTYLPYPQEPRTGVGLVVRTHGEPLAAAASVEQAIHSIDRDPPVYSIWTMDQLLGNSLAQRRLTMVLLGSFAALALLLASVGVYGVTSYAVRQRTHELGIRMALGAQARDALTLILAQGLKLTLLGIALGLGAALALTRWMESLLFGVRPTDPLTFAAIAAALFCVALLACWVPARRATKVDPMVALRHD
ncbi:MAG TPA: ABC transporter permease [Blastocatellia bacterium]|nr:ABC transporter permease [Blastocatellia bacterium]